MRLFTCKMYDYRGIMSLFLLFSCQMYGSVWLSNEIVFIGFM